MVGTATGIVTACPLLLAHVYAASRTAAVGLGAAEAHLQFALPRFGGGDAAVGSRPAFLLAVNWGWWASCTLGDAIWRIILMCIFWSRGAAVDGNSRWRSSRHNFLLPVRALSVLFRANFRDALQRTPFFDQVPATVWQLPWVVHCKPVGDGRAALKYLAPYIFRVAISNQRILKLAHDKVSFRYFASETGKPRICTVTATEFIRRFLQHVLPKGFVKVRYYGFFAPGLRRRLQAIRRQLPSLPPAVDTAEESSPSTYSHFVRCPDCGLPMVRRERVRPNSRWPPVV